MLEEGETRRLRIAALRVTCARTLLCRAEGLGQLGELGIGVELGEGGVVIDAEECVGTHGQGVPSY